jgi:hypothetical protein
MNKVSPAWRWLQPPRLCRACDSAARPCQAPFPIYTESGGWPGCPFLLLSKSHQITCDIESNTQKMLIPFAVLLSAIVTTVSARRHRSSSEKTFDCYPAGWVRAPDLYPGLSTPADARLYLNGTECDQIVKWEVGLRFRERAILKFALVGWI